MTRAQSRVFEVLLAYNMSDLEFLKVLTEVQRMLVGRMVAREHKEVSDGQPPE
jgi:hypothetical protein